MKKTLLTLLAANIAGTLAFAQKTVTTGTDKHVLVEESTGAWCGYCPDGALRLQDLIDSNPKIVGVSIHGGGTDNMKFTEGNTVTSAYFTSFPTGAVDRVPYNSKVGMSRSYWTTAANLRLAETPKFSVTLEHNYDTTSGVIDIKVTATALTAVSSAYNINVYIVEDSVSGTGSGWDQSNYYSYQYSGTSSSHYYYNFPAKIVGFQHMHVTRAMLGGAWGTTDSIATPAVSGTSYTATYSYTIPNDQKPKDIKLVGLVQKNNTFSSTDREIDNVIEATLTENPVSVSNVNVVKGDLNIYPNPATDKIHISGIAAGTSDVTMNIFNTIGQVVLTKTYKAGSIEDDIQLNLPNGLYQVVMKSEGYSAVKQIAISK